ncbi:MAG TPA: dienelactone hydrolase family protein [Solirubrobacteraceae bacterium]|nr:dienelactone hydrolase family protein [Solirubrobacteraceae bacterium]
MREQELTVTTADAEMTTFAAHPETSAALPVAVLHMDGVGYREQIKHNARRFAAEGYYCVAPELERQGVNGSVERLPAESAGG